MAEVSPATLSASDAARRMQEGLLSSEELVGACLEQIKHAEPKVKAWAFLDEKHALEQAREADQRKRSGQAVGPLNGLPVGLKDIFLETVTEEV